MITSSGEGNAEGRVPGRDGGDVAGLELKTGTLSCGCGSGLNQNIGRALRRSLTGCLATILPAAAAVGCSHTSVIEVRSLRGCDAG